MQKIVALAVWQNRISPLFDSSSQLLLLALENGVLKNQRWQTLTAQSSLERADELKNLSVDELICGAVSDSLARLIEAEGIRLQPFIAGDVEEVIDSYVAGTLDDPALRMPGCGRHRRKRRRAEMRK